MAEVKEPKSVKVEEREAVPVIFVELCDKRNSGFFRDIDGIPAGTKGTKEEMQLNSPIATFIPTTGYMLASAINPETGKTEWYNEEIRYIKNQREISVVAQNRLGIKPNRVSIEDKIIFENGNFTVAREGKYIGLFEYISKVFYNENAAGRPANLPPRFRVVEIDQESDDINEYDVYVADAIKFVSQFYQKTGKNEYVYNHEKIDSLCNLFQIFAETPSQKVMTLNALAKRDPLEFLKMAKKFEQITVTEIAHALELNVIKIDEGVASYVEKGKIFFVFPEKIKKRDAQIEKLADWFRTFDGNPEYTVFRAELEAAKEKSLTK